jgi:CheY-like chemotaxis protein
MVRPETQAIVPMIEEAVVRPNVLPMNLLVVDDQQNVRQLCADVAVQSGMKVTAVSTAEEAINILENSAVDILVTDLKLPKSGGIGSEKSSGAAGLRATENWLQAIGRARRRFSDSGRPENSPVAAGAFDAEAAKLNLWTTVTNTIVASTKYPALRHADSRNRTIPP